MKTTRSRRRTPLPKQAQHGHSFAEGNPIFPYELVLDNTIAGVCYMHERRFLWANARMAEIFGYAEGELTNRSVRTLYATEEDYEEVGRMYATLSQSHFFYTHERAMVRKNGELIWCMISGRLVSDDARSASVWVVQDITDRKHAEDQLRRANVRLEQAVQSRTLNLRRSNEALHREVERRRSAQLESVETREKYRALFRHVPTGVLVTDAKGNVTEMNGAMQSYLGASTRRELERLIFDDTRALGAQGLTSLAELIRLHLPTDSRRVERFEVTWRSTRGTRYFSAVAAALSRHGLGAVIAVQDETAQRLAREREQEQRAALAHASRVSLTGQMVMALAHDLAQPLSACQSYVKGLRNRLAAEMDSLPELAHALEKLGSNLDQAGAIIGNVRSFLSRHTPEFQPADMPTLVRQTLMLLDVQLRSGDIRVSVEVDGALPSVLCRPVEIQQVLANLIINAIDAMSPISPDKRALVIRVALERKSSVAVYVSDSGSGVPPAQVKTIFEPYVTTKVAGLGMGLMICRTIVEAHGGTIRLLTDRGPGACFKFTIPVVA